VQFEVQPDATGLEVVEGTSRISPMPDGKYAFLPGHHKATFRKDGYQPLTNEFDVSADHRSFPIKLEPVITSTDVAIQVTPPNAQLKVDGMPQSLVNGTYTQKVQPGKPLAIDVRLDDYEPVSRSFSADELTKLGNKLTINLDRKKTKLPPALVSKPGAPIDPESQLPTRVLAARLGNETMELTLVKPGKYKFGSPDSKRRPNELAQRDVRINAPFYIAITETTNAQYNRFFEAEGAVKAGSRWQNAARKWAAPLRLDPIKNHLPATNISVEQAQAFCTWAGGQLPTEVEWESAVRGLDDKGYPRPWGADPPKRERCRIFYGGQLERGEGGPVPVEQLTSGASPLGLMHAIGNAAEWCHDSEQSNGFILRGCSIITANIDDVRVTWRGQADPGGEQFTGFRVIIPASAAPSQQSAR
jgi:formylglycine-generating enzyme required for sulfatase activity